MKNNMNEKQPSPMKEKLWKTFCVSLLLSATFWFTAVNVYLGNSLEMQSLLCEVAFGMTLFCGGVFLFFALLQAAFLKSKYFGRINLFLFGIAILGYLQANILLWNVNTDIVTVVDYRTMWFEAAVEVVVYMLVFAGIYRFRGFFSRNVSRLTFVLLGAQVLVFGHAYYASGESLFFIQRDVALDEPDKTIFGTKWTSVAPLEKLPVSTEKNVIFIVLDSYGEDYFEEIMKTNREEITASLKDFTHFSRFLSPAPGTNIAIPTLLTGSDILENWHIYWQAGESRHYESELDKMYDHGDCLLGNFAKNGFQNYILSKFYLFLYPYNPRLFRNIEYKPLPDRYHLYDVLTDNIIPLTAYRFSPLILKRGVYNGTSIEIWKMYEFIQCCIFHSPLEKQEREAFRKLAVTCDNDKCQSIYEEQKKKFDDRDSFFLNLQPSSFSKESVPVFLLFHLFGVHDYEVGQELYRRDYFVAESMEWVGHLKCFFELLKGQGVYDNSYIVVLGDHGSHCESMPRQCNPILLIKRPNETGEAMRESDEIVLMRDIAPTVLSDLGMDSTLSRSLWNFTPEQKRERQGYWKRLMETSAKP